MFIQRTSTVSWKRAVWYVRRPAYWQHGLTLVGRWIARPKAEDSLRAEASAWADARAIDAHAALLAVGIRASASEGFPRIPEHLLKEGKRRADAVRVRMGGAADVDLLYAATILTRPRSVVETGVALGWSSLAILAALHRNDVGQLISVDMPYPRRKNEPWVGAVVPDDLRTRWQLLRLPDWPGLGRALRALGGSIGLAHYDSDKSYQGRMYAYPLLWKALVPGGLLISDDVQDNFAFRDFCVRNRVGFHIIRSGNKFVGLARKPLVGS